MINRHKLKVAHLGVPVRERAEDGTQDLGLLRAALLEEGWCVCEGCHCPSLHTLAWVLYALIVDLRIFIEFPTGVATDKHQGSRGVGDAVRPKLLQNVSRDEDAGESSW